MQPGLLVALVPGEQFLDNLLRKFFHRIGVQQKRDHRICAGERSEESGYCNACAPFQVNPVKFIFFQTSPP